MRKESQKGQSMVEFMLVLPISLGILLGIVVFGAAFARLEAVENAASEGGRAAQRWNVNSVDPSCADAAMNAIARATPYEVTVTISDTCPATPGVRVESGTEITVSVTHVYEPIFFSTLFGGPNTLPLTGETIATHE